jgi:alcohol dehydrogenase class IV
MEEIIMQRFTNPRDLYHGKGALEALKTLKGKKAIICVGGGSMKRFGFLGRAEEYLHEAGMETALIEGIESDPSVKTVMDGAKKMEEFQPDWIIAIGGGSPIDAAKAMWIKYEHPECTFEDMCKVFALPELRHKAKFCAVSSTSGTATEVTAFSIITDYEKGIKYPIADFQITPDVAIVDPELAETMPKKLVAHTGMDAMTHAIEAFVSTAASDFTDAPALRAMTLIKDNLIQSYNEDKSAGDAMTSRDIMHNAQCLAGIAFSSASLGIVHSMAHKTGAAFADYGAHIIHGAANAMYLPKVIAFNAKDKRAAERYAFISDYLALGGTSEQDKIAKLIELLRGMNDELNIPHCIKNYGPDSYPTEQGFVPEEVFLERLPEIAKNAILDACTLTNPRPLSADKSGDIELMEKLLKACYYDSEVDF